MRREYDFSKAKRGPIVPVPRAKPESPIRLDDEVRQLVSATSGACGRRQLSDADQSMRFGGTFGACREPLETTLRRVIREELSGAS